MLPTGIASYRSSSAGAPFTSLNTGHSRPFAPCARAGLICCTDIACSFQGSGGPAPRWGLSLPGASLPGSGGFVFVLRLSSD